MSEKQKSDQSTWDAVKNGDLKAFEVLYRSYYSDLYHYALKLTARQELAEDAVHDTFAYIWQQRKQLGDVNAVKFYLIRSVRNQCLKLLNKEQQSDTLEKVEHRIQMIIQPEEFDLTDHSQIKKQQLNKALEELSKRQREILYLKYFNNLDYEEIATLLSINYQSVVNHTHKAMIKLRKLAVLKYLKSN